MQEDLAFEMLKKKILKERGFECSQYRERYLKRRFAVRMRRHNIGSYREYMRILDEDKEEYNRLFNDLTVNVTEFFRNPETFRVLERDILPKIIERKKGENKNLIRVWSAGCASGEEAYTIAILFHEVLKDEIENFYIKIIGTDIHEQSIENAKRGEYNKDSLKNVEPRILRKYFESDDVYRVKDDVKRIVAFGKHDLVNDDNFIMLDLIICRNVVIYFSKELQTRLYQNFYDSLNNEGYLVIGKSEALLGKAAELFEAVNVKERIYKKRG